MRKHGFSEMEIAEALAESDRQEKLRLFWQGKHKKTRFCVELWLKGGVTQNEIFARYGFSPNQMHRVLRDLRARGLID